MCQVRVKREQEIEVADLGKQLEVARERAGKSVSDVCRDAGISRNYWYQLVAEEVKGALLEPTLRKLEKALNTDFGVKFD